MNPLPLSTNLLTCLKAAGVERLDVGAQGATVAGLFIAAECRTEFGSITPTEDLANAVAKLRKLEEEGLQKICRLNFCSFPLKGTDGLFEIRNNGVRIYGCRISTISIRLELLVLLGAEQKAGKEEANKSLLLRCQKKEALIHAAWKQAAQVADNDIERARRANFSKSHRRKK